MVTQGPSAILTPQGPVQLFVQRGNALYRENSPGKAGSGFLSSTVVLGLSSVFSGPVTVLLQLIPLFGSSFVITSFVNVSNSSILGKGVASILPQVTLVNGNQAFAFTFQVQGWDPSMLLQLNCLIRCDFTT
jgi:hypothetical protein